MFTANDYGTAAERAALAAGATPAEAGAAYNDVFTARVVELTRHRENVLDTAPPTRRPTAAERLHDFNAQREAW